MKGVWTSSLKEYFQALLSNFQYGFRKGYSVKNALLAMIEKWGKSIDEDGAFGAPLTDLGWIHFLYN